MFGCCDGAPTVTVSSSEDIVNFGPEERGQSQPWEEAGVGNEGAETDAPVKSTEKVSTCSPSPGHVAGLQRVEAELK